MTGRRLRYTIIGLAVLAVLAVATLLTAGDDDDGSAEPGTTATPTTLGTTPTDEELAAALLPAVSALGPDWIDTIRDDAATAVEASDAPCPAGPVPEGFLVRNEQRHTRGQELVETLSVTAGVVAPGVEPPSLDDAAIVECLRDGLQAQLGEGTAVDAVELDTAIRPANPGALVSHQRYEVSGGESVTGTFDFVLVRRGRGVSLGLLTGTDPQIRTGLDLVVAALDAPLDSVATLLD